MQKRNLDNKLVVVVFDPAGSYKAVAVDPDQRVIVNGYGGAIEIEDVPSVTIQGKEEE